MTVFLPSRIDVPPARWRGTAAAAPLLGLALLLAGCSADTTALADGSTANWSHWRDRPIVLNYWAEWCAPCRHEIPELNALHRQRTQTGAVVLGVNYDGIAGGRLAELVERMDIEFPVLVHDPMDRWGYARPDVLPTTVIVAPDGKVRKILVGPQTRESILAALRGPAHGETEPDSAVRRYEEQV